MEQVLELKNIHYTYHTLDGETPALTDISFALNKGEFVSIVGPSGCGNAMCEQRKQCKIAYKCLSSAAIDKNMGFLTVPDNLIKYHPQILPFFHHRQSIK